MRPSACEPEENLWLEAPEASPAANRPVTVVMCGVAPEVLVLGLVGLEVLGTGDPGTGGAGVRADEVRIAGHDLGGLLLGLDVGGGPENGLGDGHVQEVFPGLGLELLQLLLGGLLVGRLVGDPLDGLGRLHVDRALAVHHVQHHQPVAEVGRDRLHLAVGLPLLQLGGVVLHVVAALGVGGDRT